VSDFAQVTDKSETCLRLVGDMSLTKFVLKICRRPGLRQVSDKIDVMEFGLNSVAGVTVHSIPAATVNFGTSTDM